MHPKTLKVRLDVALIATAVVKFTPTPSRIAVEYNTGLCAMRDRPDPNKASCSKKAAENMSRRPVGGPRYTRISTALYCSWPSSSWMSTTRIDSKEADSTKAAKPCHAKPGMPVSTMVAAAVPADINVTERPRGHDMRSSPKQSVTISVRAGVNTCKHPLGRAWQKFYPREM